MARSTSVSLVLGAVLAIVVVMSSADPGYLLSCVGDCQATGYPPQPTAPGLAMMGSQSNPIHSSHSTRWLLQWILVRLSHNEGLVVVM